MNNRRAELLLRAEAKREKERRELKRKCEASLVEFIKEAWHIVEPGQPYVHGWHVETIATHLEAITDGAQFDDGTYYNRLLINIPPGMMKSLMVNVFWPAWEWGPRNMPHLRYVCASHSMNLSVRDSTKMRRLVVSEWYQSLWGDRVVLTGDQNAKTKFETTVTGFREAVAAGGITGARGDRVIIDDPLSVEDAASDAVRESRKEWFLESVPTRLNNPDRSAIIVIMQRLHEEDTSGLIIDKELGYDHIMLPMRYEPARSMCSMLGVEDRRTEAGELLFPQRFPEDVVDRDERVMGPYAAAGQLQQNPEPRGGGIIKREWWQPWQRNNYPPFDFILASLDTAYTSKEENDPSAMTVWGVWTGGDQTATITRSINRYDEAMASVERTYTKEHPKVMMIYAWSERLEFYDLLNKVKETVGDYGVEQLLIENKAAGHSISQELRRIYGYDDFGVQLIDPKNSDKVARLYSIQHLFSEGYIYAPKRPWADMVINQVSQFPKGKHDDIVDTVSMAMKWLRGTNMLVRGSEWTSDLDRSRMHDGAPPEPLYPG